MILRALFVVLVLANVGYFLWSRADDSARQAAQREPQRLTQQIQPQWLQVQPQAPSAR
ncbi:MAG: sporulation protein [Comamonadaceae bacterium]|nr:MAG: sporulation protein [Comamonadaceae bacterium]